MFLPRVVLILSSENGSFCHCPRVHSEASSTIIVIKLETPVRFVQNLTTQMMAPYVSTLLTEDVVKALPSEI